MVCRPVRCAGVPSVMKNWEPFVPGPAFAMANRGGGTSTNGSQFFITEGTPTHLNGMHTIFGQCDPVSLVTKIANVERGARDRPVKDVVIKKVTISHEKKGKKAAAK